MTKEATKVKEKKVQTNDDDDSEIYKGKELLIDVETYLKSGIHIGTKFKSGDMRKYIFKKRKDGLMVFNIETIDKRIRQIAKIINSYEPKDVAIVSRRLYATKAAKKFASITGTRVFTGRFVPGTITNPEARSFYEPKLVILTDPVLDAQALKEAKESHLPIISFVGSESPLKDIDIALPANNKGRKALALIFYLLTREVLVGKGEIDASSFTTGIEEFEQKIKESSSKKKPFNRFSRGRPRRR
jgi:small subunit ribosomal protein S2